MKKSTLHTLELIGAVVGLAAVIYAGMNQLKESDRFHEDMKIFDEGFALMDESQAAWNDHFDRKMTDDQYKTRLKQLIPRFEAHLDKMDSHLWVENAIQDRKMIADQLEDMKNELQELETKQ